MEIRVFVNKADTECYFTDRLRLSGKIRSAKIKRVLAAPSTAITETINSEIETTL